MSRKQLGPRENAFGFVGEKGYAKKSKSILADPGCSAREFVPVRELAQEVMGTDRQRRNPAQQPASERR